MNITNNVPSSSSKCMADVQPGQVFSVEDSPYILLMTDSNRYVHLRDGSTMNISNSSRGLRVKIYEHELVLKAVK